MCLVLDATTKEDAKSKPKARLRQRVPQELPICLKVRCRD